MGVAFSNSFDSPDTLQLGTVSDLLDSLPEVAYDSTSYPLYGTQLPSSDFLENLQQKLGINTRSPGAISEAINNLTPGLKVPGLLYPITNQLLTELREIMVSDPASKQLNVLRLNTLGLVFLVMDAGRTDRLDKEDVHALLLDIVSRVFHKDLVLFNWIEKFFGVYTDVGLIIKQTQIFETQETPRIKFDRET